MSLVPVLNQPWAFRSEKIPRQAMGKMVRSYRVPSATDCTDISR
jgi:hypothetical protein